MVVRFRNGKRQRVLQCPIGSKRVHKGGSTTCARISSVEKRHRKMGSRKASRTKKSHKGKQRMGLIKRQRSLRRRHAAGL